MKLWHPLKGPTGGCAFIAFLALFVLLAASYLFGKSL